MDSNLELANPRPPSSLSEDSFALIICDFDSSLLEDEVLEEILTESDWSRYDMSGTDCDVVSMDWSSRTSEDLAADWNLICAMEEECQTRRLEIDLIRRVEFARLHTLSDEDWKAEARLILDRGMFHWGVPPVSDDQWEGLWITEFRDLRRHWRFWQSDYLEDPLWYVPVHYDFLNY